MSMFHELMMRKKEEIMYATIKGTLTENDGVFSGFAYNNYLATQEEFDCSKDFEIITKVNTGNQSVTQFKVFCRNTFGANPSTSIGFAIGIEDGKIKAFFRNSNGVVVGSGTGNNGITTFANNVDCFFRFSQKKYNNTYTIQIESSLDNVNWVKEVNITSSLPLRNSGQGIAFGGGSFSNTSQYWAGSIDLNRSYIKLGSTKYNLQAVVGYTVVGSPTIVDGVVSGVNITNGIFTASSIPSFQTFESVAKVGSVWNSSGSYLPVCAFNNSSDGYKYITASNNTKKLSFSLANNDTDKMGIEDFPYATALTSSGVYIRLLAQKNTNDWTYTIAYSTDKQNWTSGQLISAVSIEGTPICFIKNLSGTTGGDTWIDMKETHIKIDNKLWFNGQQA